MTNKDEFNPENERLIMDKRNPYRRSREKSQRRKHAPPVMTSRRFVFSCLKVLGITDTEIIGMLVGGTVNWQSLYLVQRGHDVGKHP